MKAFGIVILAVIGVLALSVIGFGLKTVFMPFFGAQKTLQTGYEVIDKTMTGENAILNYEWFKQQVESIRAVEKKIMISKKQIIEFKEMFGETSTWSFETKNEYARLSSIKMGQMSQLEDMVATYNARTKMANRNLFNDDLMPGFLEIGVNVLTK